MKTPLRILHLEDDPKDAELIRATLEAAGFAPEIVVVQTKADYLEQLGQGWDLVLSDYKLPQFDGLQALELFKERGLDIAFILISGTIGEEAAVAAMQAGASDYILKDRLARLGPVVQRGLRETVERRARLRAEAALRESEEHLTALVHSVDGIVWEADAVTFQFTFVSSQAERLLGYPLARWLEEPTFWAEHIHPEDRETTVRFCVANTQENRDHEFEYRMLAADGRTIWLRDIVAVVSDNGQAVKLRGLMVDITGRREAEAALHASETRWQFALEGAGDGVWDWDVSTDAVFFSKQWKHMLGLTDAEVGTGLEDWSSRVHPDDLPRVMADLQPHLDGVTTSYTNEHRVRCKDGSYSWILDRGLVITRDAVGKPLRVVGTHTDITARRAAEEQMRLLEASVARLNDAVMITEADLLVAPGPRIVFVNDAAERMTGYNRAELIGQTPRLFQGPKTDRAELDRVAAALRQGKPVHAELINYTKAGADYWVEMDITPVESGSGVVTHFVAIERDVTARKTLETQMISAQRHEAIGTLASGLAHDLNNILTPMLLMTDLLEHPNMDSGDRQLLASAKTSAQRGAAIVRQLLAYSRGAEGERQLVAMTLLIQEMTSVARATFPRDITVIEDTDVDLWSLVADVTQIQQILMNLFVNARDAMPAGGELSITATNVELVDGDLRLGPSGHPGRFVHVAVRDTGTGIPRPIIDRIFEPFFTTKAIGMGSGLGLSSVLGIVRSHSGFITADSTPAHGTTFHVYLPATGEAPPTRMGEPTPPPTVAHGATILVVDDEVPILRLAQRCLEKNGYRVLTATNGQEALKLFEAHERDIQLVLTDLMMPVMGGVEFARALHLLAPELRVIGASGLEAITVDGIDELLEKPFTVDALLAAVGRQLQSPAR